MRFDFNETRSGPRLGHSIVLALGLILATLVRFAPAVQASDTADASRRPPNMVLILTDDQGYQDVGCFGSPDIKTPRLDRMADEGMRFTDFYVAASVCSASRAALMTGCYPGRVGIRGTLLPRHNVGLNPDEITVAEVLKQKDYATGCFGKWHLGHRKPFLPTNQGFDYYFGIPYSNDMAAPRRNCPELPLMRNTDVIEAPVDQTTITKRYTDEAVRFIRENRERPFFVYLPHTMPHVPLAASETFQGTSERGLYGDVIEEIDWSVGQILDTLEELDLDEKTLVLFTSDNGPRPQRGGEGGSALPLRDGHSSVYEGGMRVPCIARWPGRIPAGTVCSEVAATIDILPTFAELAGADVPDDRIIDGRSIVRLMEDTPGATTPHRIYFYRDRAVRGSNWKLHLARSSRGRQRPVELYDLDNDISEEHNLASQRPDLVRRLTQFVLKHQREIAENRRPIGSVD